jgi:hypothetical protein
MATQIQRWVVYKMTIHGKSDQLNAVCEQSEWDAMELARPGYHTLIHTGITSENEADKLARGLYGDTKPPRLLASTAVPGVRRQSAGQ